MDQSSSHASFQGTDASPSWSTMGGTIGEGGFRSTESQVANHSNSIMGGTPSQYQQQQQPMPPYQQQQLPPHMSIRPGGGAISNPSSSSNSYGTTSAPAPGSYASRSAQAYAQLNPGQPSVTVNQSSLPPRQQQYNPNNNNNNYNAGGMTGVAPPPPQTPPPPPPQQPPPVAPGVGPAATGSYGARSAPQAYTTSAAGTPPHPGTNYGGAATPPFGTTPTPQNTPAVMGSNNNNNNIASSYAARSQQAYAHHAGTIASPPSGYFGGSTAAPQTASPVRNFNSGMSNSSQMAATGGGGGGGYAARSAQAHAAVTSPPPPTASNPPSTVVVNPPPAPYASTPYRPNPDAAGGGGVGTGGGYVPSSSDMSVSASTIATTPTTAYGGGSSPQYGGGGPNNSINPASSVYGSAAMSGNPSVVMANSMYGQPPQPQIPGMPQAPPAQAVQQRLLTEATRKVQEHAYYMRQAMDQNNLPSVLERAAYMAGELGVPPHGSAQGATAPSLSNTGISIKLTPKNYYELYMRALEDMPSLEDYLLGLATTTQSQQQQSSDAASYMGGPAPGQAPFYGDAYSQQQQQQYPPNKPQPSYTMKEIYDCVQFCPRVLSRLYLQISAGSALIRSGEVGPKFVMKDLIQCVKCEQNPIRGLFLRNYLLTVLRDKLPDTTNDKNNNNEAAAAANESSNTNNNSSGDEDKENNDESENVLEKGTVKDSYEFVMENFMEMNKLWVRLQHLPGDGNTKEVKKRRERERNDLRILVGTNLVRISQLEGVTSKIYGENILPRVLDHIVMVGDPLSQAYLMDCLVQVFPDEYHIETLPILLNVCPRLRDKVNIRTILQGLMDRLANYLAEEELLDESDTNQVKLTLARDSFGMFEECVQKVYNARGPKLTSKEVIRLQTALLQFSLKCYPGNLEQVAQCMGACVSALQQANTSYDINATTAAQPFKALDDVSVVELEKLLSIPLESLALRVLELEKYSELIEFLPWANRRAVAQTMLEAVDKAGAPPKTLKEIQQLFTIIEPLTCSEAGAASNSATIASTTADQPYHRDPTARATSLMAGLGVVDQAPVNTTTTLPSEFGSQGKEGPLTPEVEKECALVCKLVHLLHHENTDLVYQMLETAREQIRRGGKMRASRTLVAVVFAALGLARRIHNAKKERKTTTTTTPPNASDADKKSENNEKDDSKSNGNVADADKETSQKENEATSENEKDGKDASAEEKEDTSEKDKDEKDGSTEGKEDTKNEDTATGDDEVAKASTEDGEQNDKGEVDLGLLEQKANDIKKEEEEQDIEILGDGQKKEESPIHEDEPQTAEVEAEKLITSRQVFVFVQQTIALVSKANAEIAAKLFIEAALAADNLAVGKNLSMYAPVAYELLSQSFSVYEEGVTDSHAQRRTITVMIGALLTCKSLSESDYEGLITKAAQHSAKLVIKPDQCQLVAQCAHLFYPVNGLSSYRNPQRALECLQRSLKLADACTSSNPSQMFLFVELLEHYVFFLEKKNPSVNAAYVTGLAALVKEYLRNATDARAVSEARNHYLALLKEIQRKKSIEPTSELFASVEVDPAGI